MVRQGQVRDAQKPWDEQRLSTGTVSKGQNSPIARSALGPRERVLFSSPEKRQLFQGFDGGRTRARTLDPLIKSQLLYQLSYAPIASAGRLRSATAGV
jgi:hypothetical protein